MVSFCFCNQFVYKFVNSYCQPFLDTLFDSSTDSLISTIFWNMGFQLKTAVAVHSDIIRFCLSSYIESNVVVKNTDFSLFSHFENFEKVKHFSCYFHFSSVQKFREYNQYIVREIVSKRHFFPLEWILSLVTLVPKLSSLCSSLYA